jgi:REP element-mobilizing transposase RayT
MRKARITYEGAIHHVMNRGYDGLPIFKRDREKGMLLKLLEKNAEKCKVSLLAYCIMDNHYHMIIQNSTGKMPDFFRRVNGEFANFYRKRYGGRGYVFQDRYKSTLVQDDAYLLIVIAYVLNNPVRVGIADNFLEYEWSSGSKYFSSRQKTKLVDITFVEELFSNIGEFFHFVIGTDIEDLPSLKTELGRIIGGEEFYIDSLKKFNRRKHGESLESMRSDDQYFEPIDKIYYEFKRKYGVDPDKLKTNNFEGKRLRGQFLIYLKDRGGLTYREIKKFDVFSDVKFNSLGKMYKDAMEKNMESL